jgi:hypothetical protein
MLRSKDKRQLKVAAHLPRRVQSLQVKHSLLSHAKLRRKRIPDNGEMRWGGADG